MSSDDDDAQRARPRASGLDLGPEIAAVFDDLETLLKNGDVIAALTERGVNASIALLAAHALRAYLTDRKAEAAEDFTTVAEEIRGRLESSKTEPGAGNAPEASRPRSNGRR